MDGHGLLALLERIRPDVPGPLQGAFDELVQLVRNIVDALDQVIAPQEVIDTGKHHLSTHYNTLLNHATTLKSNLDDFQKAGIDANSDWINYLMRILGAGLTAKAAGAVIRCMISKGYMPQITDPSKASKIQIALKRVWNSLGHLTQQDLEGAWKDVHPDRVTYPKGGLPSGADHLGEVQNAIQSLQNFLNVALDALTNPATPENLRQVYQNLYDACDNTIQYVTGKIYGSDPPITWSDEGKIPFGDDLINKSGCLFGPTIP